MTSKSRHISTAQFVQVLSVEYMAAFARSKYKRRQRDKDYWAKVAGHKKEKILDITKRNMVPSMFDNDDHYTRVYCAMREFGIPEWLTDEDLEEYYNAPGADVVATVNGTRESGHIVSTDLSKRSCVVKIDGSEYRLKLADVRRYL